MSREMNLKNLSWDYILYLMFYKKLEQMSNIIKLYYSKQKFVALSFFSSLQEEK